MEGSAGGRVVEGGLRRLEEALLGYFGALNELEAGLEKVEVPEQPEALKLWRQCQSIGLPLYEGGLMNQPHIWLLEVALIAETERLFAALAARNRENADAV